MNRLALVHPLLFALFFALALYATNVAWVFPSDLVLPVLMALGTAVLLMSLAFLLFRDGRKAALLATVLTVLGFSYGHVRSPLVFLLCIGLGGLIGYFVRRTRMDLHNTTVVLSVLGIGLVIVPSVNITVKEMGRAGIAATSSDPVSIEVKVPATQPDIYYIILDRYASESTLRELYDFDNSDFLDYLREKGFYVADESCANYFHTAFSLASSLNMMYLDGLADSMDGASRDRRPIIEMLRNNEVLRSLKAVGYQTVNMGSHWEPTRVNPYADVNIAYKARLPEFSMLFLNMTAFAPVAIRLNLWGEIYRTQWERVRYKFDRLGEMPATETPKFVFAHFLVPHDPYVFDRDGAFVPRDQALRKELSTAYLDQLVATNAMVMSLVERLLRPDTKPSPVVIIQADEGPILGGASKWKGLDDATDAEVQEVIRILNAYYLPGVDTSVLYPSISPVNSFRVVFNLYFGTDLALLPDRSYIFRKDRLYDFVDVTERVRYVQ